jgi:5-methylcytosine-specific restriction endonuclease McrA
MFEAEITLGLLLLVWIAYEIFGRPTISAFAYITDLSYYIRIASGLCVLAYLYWQARENPSGLNDTLNLAKQVMTHTHKTDRYADSGKEKRNVTNLMKKTVAANQKWSCAHCKEMLDSSYEVDHKIALFNGGSNDIENLVALCRNCHGKKTMKERLPTK